MQIIKQHNKKILQLNQAATISTCSCREKPKCPLDGACLTKSIVYMAEVTSENREQKKYIGMTENDFKGRCCIMCINNLLIIQNMKILRLCPNTSDVNYDIKWSILRRTEAYVAGSRKCNLC